MELPTEMNIASILATKGGHVITIRPEHTVKAAVAALVQHNIGALVVVNAANDLVGIVTERHIVREVAGNPQVFTQTIGDIMTRDVITGAPHDDLMSVARTMAEERKAGRPRVPREPPTAASGAPTGRAAAAGRSGWRTRRGAAACRAGR